MDGGSKTKKNVNKNNKHSERKFIKNITSSSDLLDVEEEDLDEMWS